MDYINKKTAIIDVVVDISLGTNEKIGLLLETLLCLDEGVDCHYWLQLGHRRLMWNELELLVAFQTKKKASLSYTLPEFSFPQELLDSEAVKTDHDSCCGIGTGVKYNWFKRNLSFYKAIFQYERFVYLTPDAVILKDGWLKFLEEKQNCCEIPINGYPLKIKSEAGDLICGWSTVGLYDSKALRLLPIEEVFTNRIRNPWYAHINSDQKISVHCLAQEFMSAFDTPLNHILFALFYQNLKGDKNIQNWGIETQTEIYNSIASKSHYDLDSTIILVDKSSDVTAKENLKNHYNQSTEIKSFDVPENIRKLPVGGSEGNPILDNHVKLNLMDLHNSFNGKRCFIIGNGPSLKKTDLKKLKNEFTIGLNRIYLNYENMGFQTSFLCATNPNIINQFSDDFECLSSIKFLRYQTRDCIKNKWNVFFMEHAVTEGFSNNIGNFIWNEGCTVTYCAMQIAYFMGFKTVYLVGVDHNFPDSGKPHQLVTSNSEDVNHFHPNYFGKGVKWQYPDLEGSEKSYLIAKSVYENDGRIILDATVDGSLEVFKKCDYNALF